MNAFLAQLILARRSEDTNQWTNILFIVVLAVFWALAGIFKARAKKTQEGDTGQSPRRPVRQPPAQSRTAREQQLRQAGHPVGPAERQPHRPGLGQARTRLAELRAAAQKFAAEAEQAFRVQIQQAAQKAQPAMQRPTSPPEPSDVLESPAKLPTAPQPEDLPPPEETLPSDYLPGLLSDYTDPDHLRRAILHYEILGRPLSLRDPP
ncbi:MAG TPA: hypothetical protein VMW24_23470 [Sedimentisphaerales bacterium]|nr:hypothetical protein [Sedimentisphaerales bacterium]